MLSLSANLVISQRDKVALKTALSSYAAARDLITSELEPLVAQELRAIKDSILEAFDVSSDGTKVTTKRRIRWDSKHISGWVAALNELVSRFEERVEILLRACDNVDIAIEALGTVAYDRKKFCCAVENVQKVVDELSLAGYSNLASWGDRVNSNMGVLLATRFKVMLKEFAKTL